MIMMMMIIIAAAEIITGLIFMIKGTIFIIVSGFGLVIVRVITLIEFGCSAIWLLLIIVWFHFCFFFI